jgi:hypothetical protein
VVADGEGPPPGLWWIRTRQADRPDLVPGRIAFGADRPDLVPRRTAFQPNRADRPALVPGRMALVAEWPSNGPPDEPNLADRPDLVPRLMALANSETELVVFWTSANLSRQFIARGTRLT